MTFKRLLGTLETIIQNHFKPQVSFLKLLEIGMHCLHLLYPLLNVLRNASLDSHHWWALGNSFLICWPWWMHVSWCVTSKLVWFWFIKKNSLSPVERCKMGKLSHNNAVIHFEIWKYELVGLAYFETMGPTMWSKKGLTYSVTMGPTMKFLVTS